MGDERCPNCGIKMLTQYRRDLIRMWDSLRDSEKGADNCHQVNCLKCPLYEEVCFGNVGKTAFNAEEAIKIVTQWAKDHPIITMRDKYKETFGVEPIEVGCWRRNAKSYLCPKYAGFDIGTCPVPIICSDCAECKEKFWASEFKKREVVQSD